MLRSLLEGICFEIRNGIDIVNKYVKVEDIYITGDYLTVSRLMRCRQISMI